MNTNPKTNNNQPMNEKNDQPNAELDAANREAINLALRRAELWEEILEKADPKLRQEFIEVDEAATAASQRAQHLESA